VYILQGHFRIFSVSGGSVSVSVLQLLFSVTGYVLVFQVRTQPCMTVNRVMAGWFVKSEPSDFIFINRYLIFSPKNSALAVNLQQAVVRGTTNPAPCCYLANDTDLLTA